MIARIVAALNFLGAIVSVLALGPGQFGYAFLGMIAGFGAVLKLMTPNPATGSGLLMIAAPLGVILIGMSFMLFTALTMTLSVFRVIIAPAGRFVQWACFLFPFLLSMSMLGGLCLLRAFPGTSPNGDPVGFSDEHFYYPISLAIGSLCLKLLDKSKPNTGRQATASPSPAT